MEPIQDFAGALPALPGKAHEERRRTPDRRRRPTSLWAAFLLRGRRRRNRRAEQHVEPHFVDRFSSATFVLVLSLLGASILDAVLTIDLLRAGADELHPLMDRFLEHGIEVFLAIKYALTAGGLPLLLVFQYHYLFGTRIRVGHLIPVVVAMYAVLIGYQLVLLHRYGIP
jgi:hypothetical protein